jgi:hypothetical protein
VTGAKRAWPPLIVAEHAPRAIRWRDSALTLCMWALFAIMLETEFEMFFGDIMEAWGLGEFDTDARWVQFFIRLAPFIWTTVALVALLVLASTFTVRRVRRWAMLPEPAPLELALEARSAGTTEAALEAARALKIAVVHIDADGRLRIEPKRAQERSTA